MRSISNSCSKPRGVTHDDLEPHVKAVPVELDDVQGLARSRRRWAIARQPLEVTGTAEPGATLEGAQAFGAHDGRQGPDAHVVGVEWVVGRRQLQGPALIEKRQVQLRQGANTKAQTVVGADLLDRYALGADLVGDPLRQGRVGLDEKVERASGAESGGVAQDLGRAPVSADMGVGHQGAPTVRTTV